MYCPYWNVLSITTNPVKYCQIDNCMHISICLLNQLLSYYIMFCSMDKDSKCDACTWLEYWVLPIRRKTQNKQSCTHIKNNIRVSIKKLSIILFCPFRDFEVLKESQDLPCILYCITYNITLQNIKTFDIMSGGHTDVLVDLWFDKLMKLLLFLVNQRSRIFRFN